MKTKLLLILFCIGFVGIEAVSIAKPPTSNNVQEQINGIPVYRQSGSFIAPETLDGLISTSDLVVIAKINQSIEEAKSVPEVAADGTIGAPISQVQGEIRQVFKGNFFLKGQTITIGQQAAVLTAEDGKPYIRAIDDYQPFKKGRYLLFLKKGFDGQTYFPIGVYYGKYNIDGTDTSEDVIQDETFKNIRSAVRQRFKDSE
ncbi:hypothetical protein I8748_29890 [Nostoc sp. CENA67]|uniref:Uncharacterized protein n=1 Tax=Amazonocrinis nigriterrae CENA67 TaxID=2794033 RepID=A0A8J7HZ48_9NOST|nr:hypothetical protein [Amazonocrinis nigriterrae]MBH8566315.1 hypothetical protein [Amazonocrinis nigriterrae CENA67]